MYDLLNRCGLQLDRHNSMCCPLHREKTPSFKVYKDGSRFKCFGCGIGGDVITFAMRYYSLSYGQAILRLASEFGLPIAGTRPPTAQDRIRAAEERRARKREAEERNREYDRLFDAYLLACDEFIRLEGNLIRYKPRQIIGVPDDDSELSRAYDETVEKQYVEAVQEQLPLNDLYCEAIQKLSYQSYKCDMLQSALKNHVKRSDERASTEEKAIEWDGIIQ